MANKWVYMFSEGDMTMRNLLGGKGANLAEMTSIGLPVPQGFTITTEACTQYYEDGRKINDEIMAQAMEGVKKMEEINGKKFGDLKNPLLVSVRSGARASMPGMMDTILNLGLNDEVVDAMIKGNPDPAFERRENTGCTLCIHGYGFQKISEVFCRTARRLVQSPSGPADRPCGGGERRPRKAWLWLRPLFPFHGWNGHSRNRRGQ